MSHTEMKEGMTTAKFLKELAGLPQKGWEPCVSEYGDFSIIRLKKPSGVAITNGLISGFDPITAMVASRGMIVHSCSYIVGKFVLHMRGSVSDNISVASDNGRYGFAYNTDSLPHKPRRIKTNPTPYQKRIRRQILRALDLNP